MLKLFQILEDDNALQKKLRISMQIICKIMYASEFLYTLLSRLMIMTVKVIALYNT